MARKHKRSITVCHIDGTEVTLRQMPKYYPASRCGVHGDNKYNRRRFKQQTQRVIKEDM